jgi:hypothetical protein
MAALPGEKEGELLIRLYDLRPHPYNMSLLFAVNRIMMFLFLSQSFQGLKRKFQFTTLAKMKMPAFSSISFTARNQVKLLSPYLGENEVFAQSLCKTETCFGMSKA